MRAGGTSNNTHTRTGSPDMFDVPSEDEFVSRPIKSVQRLPAKSRTHQGVSDQPITKQSVPILSEKPVKAAPTSWESENKKLALYVPKKQQKASRVPLPNPVPPSSVDIPTAPRSQRSTTPQTLQKAKQDTASQKVLQRHEGAARAASKPTVSVSYAPKSSKSTKATSTLPLRKTSSNRQANKSEDVGVFDIPSSDEEMPLAGHESSRQASAGKAKPAHAISEVAECSRKGLAVSDGSSTLKKRKRRGSASSVATAQSIPERKEEPPPPQRSYKHQRKENSVSPGHESLPQLASGLASEVRPTAAAVNKPRRTRMRTVPMLAKPAMKKGQSAPATLNSMLPTRPLSKQSPIQELSEVAATEDETMYEISDPLTTPVRAPKSTNSGSVTPRQKALFSSLLGDSSSSATPMPKISALQLTDQNPKSILGMLAKSKSDLSSNAQHRKVRLIDTIKRSESSSEDEEDEEEGQSASETESEEEFNPNATSEHSIQEAKQDTFATGSLPTGAELDNEARADSQKSQAAYGFGTRSKLTYATSRSYLEEANIEDALLVSMDLDDHIGFDSQRDNVTEDEEDPMSQVQARHELKRRGQQTAFQWETETLINDISKKTNNSVRRSTMLELCSKMADGIFTAQLLESSLAHQFFQNTSTNGEIVFDFTTAVAVIFVLQTDPTSTVLGQIHRAGILPTLVTLAGNEADIGRIAKDRKTNLSKLSQESVQKFRTLVRDSSIWTSDKPEKLSPQIVALKAMEMLVLCMCRAGSTGYLVDQDEVSKLVDISSRSAQRMISGQSTAQDSIILDSIISILESASIANQKQHAWSAGILQRLADILPLFFQPGATVSTILAVKLCMNLTNNKPRACKPFSGSNFVVPLTSFITRKFGQLDTAMNQEQRTEVLEALILSLGAMINLAELSDEARMSVDDNKQNINTLVKIFIEGSERAAQVSE